MDCSITLHSPCDFSDQHPLVIRAKKYDIIYAESDQVWLDRIDNLTVGTEVRQDKVFTTDHEIMQQFKEAWECQMETKLSMFCQVSGNKFVILTSQHSHSLNGILNLGPTDALRRVISSKKRTAATGPDGVSRSDLLSLPPSGLQTFREPLCHA